MEPKIIINGIKMPESAAMTLRVAVSHLHLDLINDTLLLQDELSNSVKEGYLQNLNLIISAMMKPKGAIPI